ncbi:MAG: VOC family protein [Rhizobiales bacterium]|nr:VOC family protein [Hyphomicrobiales bacterium]
MIADLSGLEVITLFVEDLPAADAFYRKVFVHEAIFGDAVCSILRIGNIVINLLKIENAATLVEPEQVGNRTSGARALYTVKVKDANAVCSQLKALGVPLLNGPTDRPWGRRTAAFADPAGNVWEVAQELP